MALIVYVPIWFIVIQGRDAFTAGLAILPLTAPMLVVPLLAGRMAQRVSPGLLSGIGFLVSAIGAWLLMGLSPDGSLWMMAIPMLLIGIGNGLPWGLMDALSVSVVPKERAGMAAGIFTTMRVAGEAIAIGAVLIGLTAANLRAAAQANSLSLPQDATVIAGQIGAGAGHGPSAGAVGAVDGTIIELARHAYTSAFHSIFGVLAVLSILTAVVCIVTLRQSADPQGTAQES
nr:MFS transporter [Azotobacter vinelandii]